jgi:RNA polymerase sigma-70 factor (ECF subfamily)
MSKPWHGSMSATLPLFTQWRCEFWAILKRQRTFWLAVITRNRAIDSLRKRRPEANITDVVVCVEPDLVRGADRGRALEKIRGALGSMPLPQRSALEMAFFEGLSHNEIAEKTGEPLGTIKTRIRAGLLTLRKAFNQ